MRSSRSGRTKSGTWDPFAWLGWAKLAQHCRRVGAAFRRLHPVSGDESLALSTLRAPPPPLLLPVAAILHTAPLPAVAFARVDKVDAAIRCTALPDPLPVDGNQQLLDREGAGMQRHIGRKWL